MCGQPMSRNSRVVDRCTRITVTDGSTDGTEFTMLFRAPYPTYLGDDLQYFLIETTNKYNYYRLTCLEAEEGNPGLSYFQLFVYNE